VRFFTSRSPGILFVGCDGCGHEHWYPTYFADLHVYDVSVYEGHFDIPFAASLSHSQKAQAFLAAKQFPATLAEAEQGHALAKLGENECDARRYLSRHGASGRGAYVLPVGSTAGKNGRTGIPECPGRRAREKVGLEQTVNWKRKFPV
jgi:hypothetical protein